MTSQERDTWLEERTVNQEKILTASSFKLFLRLILLKVLFCIGIQSVGLQESDTTQPLNNNNKIVVSQRCVTFKHTAKWLSYTLAAWCEGLTHLKIPWCWERSKVGEEGDDRGWGGWMAPLTGWTWVWVNSGSWWWTGRPGAMQSMGSQRVGHDWATEPNWTVPCIILFQILFLLRLLQNTEQTSLCCTAGLCWLSLLNIACVCQF